MVLLRKVIGDALRARRLGQHRTLREVSTAANVSLGYLSEIERGHKEASSELLAAICEALGAPLSSMLNEVSTTMALAEQMDDHFRGTPPLEPATAGARPTPRPKSTPGQGGLDPAALGAREMREELDALESGLDEVEAALKDALSEGDVTVSVHSDGPLRTRLTAKRVPPGQRYTETLFVG